MEALLTIKSVVPLTIYVLRYFVEGIIVDRKILRREWFRKTGPDLCYMATILTSFNMIQKNTGFYRSLNGLNNQEVFVLFYIAFTIIAWLACMHFYKKMVDVCADTNNANIHKCTNGALSFLIAGILFMIAIKNQ